MSLDEEHDERVELFVSIHETEKVSRISLCEDLVARDKTRIGWLGY